MAKELILRAFHLSVEQELSSGLLVLLASALYAVDAFSHNLETCKILTDFTFIVGITPPFLST